MKPIRNFYPRNIELKYTKFLRSLYKIWLNGLLQDLKVQLPLINLEAHRYDSNLEFLDRYGSKLPETDQIIRLDVNHAEKIRLIVNKHKGVFDTAFMRIVSQHASDVFYQTDGWTSKQQDRVEKHLGVDLKKSTLWKEGKAQAFIHQNTALIKKLSDEVAGRVETTLFASIQKGKTTRDITKDLMEAGNFTKSRATLIARDQVSKLNSELTRTRQQQAGIDSYIWSTAEDERTCDKCAPRDGKSYSWDDEPRPGEIHPQCRCTAEADIDKMFDL